MHYEKASQCLSGHVLAARSRASTRMHVRKRKASYFNCNFMASLRFAVLSVTLQLTHFIIVHAFSIWDEQVYDPQSNACDSSLNARSDRSRNSMCDRKVHDRLLGAVG